jgi:PTS system nitrogen regulatory IIA component
MEGVMRLADYIDPRLVLVDHHGGEGQQLFEPLVEKICGAHAGLNKEAILERLLEREKKYCTGLECGIAVPHALIEGLEKPICLVARMKEPIEFGTLDGSQVGILFLLVSPQDSIASHIRILARIARICTIPAFLERMLKAGDDKELYDTICKEDARHV